jgi:flagellar biosynthesis regulator FlbT
VGPEQQAFTPLDQWLALAAGVLRTEEGRREASAMFDAGLSAIIGVAREATPRGAFRNMLGLRLS